jgi:pre-rRNA-processing protein IPI3
LYHIKPPGFVPSTHDCPKAEFIQDNAFFVQPNTIGTLGALSAYVAKLDAEVENSREQLGNVKGADDMMWEKCVQKVMTQERRKVVVEDQSTISPGEGELFPS